MPSQLELDVAAAVELLDVLAKASQAEAETAMAHHHAAAAASSGSSSSPRRPSTAGSSEAIDAPAVVPGQTSAVSLNRDDLDAAAAVAFVFETTVGAGLTATWGRALVVAKLTGSRGWFSAPLYCRVASLGAGMSLGVRRCATLAFLGKQELEKLKSGRKVRVRAGASLCLAVPFKAPSTTSSSSKAAADSGSDAKRAFRPIFYRSQDLGFDFDSSSSGGVDDVAPDYRVSRGVMVDLSLRVGVLAPCDKLTREALALALDQQQKQGGKEKEKAKIDREALLSGRAPFDAPPKVLRPLARRLNLAAGLEHRPAAPWPGVSR